LLARAGIASRREIERMIAEGRIALNGAVLDTPATVLASLEGVTVDGKPVEAPTAARLFRYHKTAGLLTAERDFTGRPTIYDRMPKGLPRVMPVGRLDLNTEGLLLLTTDGELKRQLELPSSGVERSYRARAYGNVTQAQLEDLMLGVEIEGVRYGAINANLERRTGANIWIEMTLTEGKNREVRRVLEYLGLQVSRLIRTRYGPFHLGDLPAGDVDEIRASDLNTFRTVLSKPGGGKAASNLQFSVRERVMAPAPKPADEDLVRKPRPGRVSTTPRREPENSRMRVERPARTEPRPAPAEGETRRARPEAQFTPRTTPAARTDRAPREDRTRTVAQPARAARAKAHRETREPKAGDLVERPRTPRGAGRVAGSGPARPPSAPARPPGKGPAGGRGKPNPNKRPPRTRK
jgi:23S rRNA pseudouridine2605 synthase